MTRPRTYPQAAKGTATKTSLLTWMRGEGDVLELRGPSITTFGGGERAGSRERHTAAADAEGAYAQTLCWFDMAGFTTQYHEASWVFDEATNEGVLTYESVLGGRFGSVTFTGAGLSSAWAKSDAENKRGQLLYQSSFADEDKETHSGFFGR